MAEIIMAQAFACLVYSMAFLVVMFVLGEAITYVREWVG